MGHTDDLLDGIAQFLATAGVGVFHDSAYAQTDVGIGIGDLPEDCDRAIGIADYLTNDPYPDQAMSTIGVQLAFRGAPNDRKSMTDLRDAAYQALQNLTYQQFGSCGVTQVLRVSSVPLGQDDHDRWEMTDNYYIDVTVPATANRA
jgi:hypothetical protein